MLTLLRESYAQLKLEEYEKAREACLEALQFRNELQSLGLLEYVLDSLGATWLFQESFADEITFFSDYIERHPGDIEAYIARAGARWYSGLLREAVSDYSRALDLNPSSAKSLASRGQLLAELNNHEEALQDLDLALVALQTKAASQPEWIEWCRHSEGFVRRGRAVALAGLGKNKAAIEEFENSITLSPENAWVYFSRAQFYDAAGNHDQASSDYQTALAKKEPRLTPIQRNSVQERLRDLRP